MTSSPSRSTLTTREKVFKHKKSSNWLSVLQNSSKLFDALNNDLYVQIKFHANYAEKGNVCENDLQVDKKNKVQTLSLTSYLSKADFYLKGCMDTVHENVMRVGQNSDHSLVNIGNLVLYKNVDKSIFKTYTCLKLDSGQIINLDTGYISLWPNQQDLAFYCLNREYCHYSIKSKVIEFTNEFRDLFFPDRYFKTKISIENVPFANRNCTWPRIMQVTEYSYGKSYPLLATVKNSPFTKKVIIITSCPLISYEWTRYCILMGMHYNVLEGCRWDAEESSQNNNDEILKIADNTPHALIIDLPQYLSKASPIDRRYFNDVDRCIVDVQGIHLESTKYLSNHMHYFVETMKRDKFEIIYNLSKSCLPEPSETFGDCTMSFMETEILVMPAANIYDDNVVNIQNEKLYIRKPNLCSIVMFEDAENVAPNIDWKKEEYMRQKFNLPNFLVMYPSMYVYLEKVLEIFPNDSPRYLNKIVKMNELKCQICYAPWKDIISNPAHIIYSCCCASCCVQCFWDNIKCVGEDNALKCFNCKTINLEQFDDTLSDFVDQYLLNIDLLFTNNSRVLIMGHFPSNAEVDRVQQYLINWFRKCEVLKFNMYNIFHEPMSVRDLEMKRIDDLSNPSAILFDVSKLIHFPRNLEQDLYNLHVEESFKAIHFDNINTVVFLPSIPFELRKLYMNSFACSSFNLKIFHFFESTSCPTF